MEDSHPLFDNLGHKNVDFSVGVNELHSGVQFILGNDSVKAWFRKGDKIVQMFYD